MYFLTRNLQRSKSSKQKAPLPRKPKIRVALDYRRAKPIKQVSQANLKSRVKNLLLSPFPRTKEAESNYGSFYGSCSITLIEEILSRGQGRVTMESSNYLTQKRSLDCESNNSNPSATKKMFYWKNCHIALNCIILQIFGYLFLIISHNILICILYMK